jgi:tripartite-type tricarboxylate transporter receptor subunit TctC
MTTTFVLRVYRSIVAVSVSVVTAIVLSAPALAQPAPTLAGRTVQLIVGFGAGGGFDLWGRLVARHLGRHLPGHPTVVVQNMPGAGGLMAANHIYNVAPKDGTAIALVASSTPLGPIFGASGARFISTRLTWLGTPTIDTNTCVAFNSPQVKVKTLNELYQTELVVGGTGPGAGTYAWPKALSALLGMKFKVVGGFPSAANVLLAMERGEVEGICESYDSVKNRKPDWIPAGTIKVLFQAGAEPNAELKGVPYVLDLARTAEEKATLEFVYAGQGIGRPFVAPPDLPPERLKMLRDAFNATMKDPEFIADAKKTGLDLEPEDGEHLAALINKIYATPKPIVERIGKLIK